MEMRDIDVLRRETDRLCALSLAGVNPYQVVNDMHNHMERLQAALDEKHDDRLDDLATLVRRLVHEVRKGSQNNKLASNAMDYLARKDLLPDTLRSDDE